MVMKFLNINLIQNLLAKVLFGLWQNNRENMKTVLDIRQKIVGMKKTKWTQEGYNSINLIIQ
tara:strand:- start:6413 stop:6598 length:186 start_codon:yes stop_codon:yes gene_type:complete